MVSRVSDTVYFLVLGQQKQGSRQASGFTGVVSCWQQRVRWLLLPSDVRVLYTD